MKIYLIAAAVTAILSTPAVAADTGVSIRIGQPGFYGRLDIGGYPPPRVIYPQPRIVERIVIERPPIYLRVPPGHARNWKRHCHKYNACDEQVYFVQDNWYKREYAPRYHEQRRHEHRDEQGEGYRSDDLPFGCCKEDSGFQGRRDMAVLA